MSDAGADGPFEVAVEPCNDRCDPDDEGSRDQVATLYADLDTQADTVRGASPVDGAKGAGDQRITALGSAVVFGAPLTCLRVWLERDQDRCISVAITAPLLTGGPAETTLTIKEGAVNKRSRKKRLRILSFDSAHPLQI